MYKFKEGDIIEWCDEYFYVLENYGTTGTVKQCSKNGKLIDSTELHNFYWNYGEESKLIKQTR